MSDAAGSLDVAGIGSMVVDAIHSAPRIIGPDEKLLLEPRGDGAVVRRFVGGVTLNHLGWAALLGLRTAVFGKQADDDNGRFLRDGMRKLGIEQHLDLSGSASSFAQVYVDPDGRRSIYMARGATAELTPGEIDAQHRPVIERARLVTSEVSQVPLPVVRRVLEIARETGARTVVDLDVPLQDAVPGLGTEEDLQAVLALADVLKPSLSATRGLVVAADPEAIGAELRAQYGAQIVAITAGEQGSVVVAGDGTLRSPAARIRVADTTGAGDAFLGGLLAGIHYELSWEDALRLGNACGACCCERVGAYPDDPEGCRSRVLELFLELGGPALELGSPSFETTREAGRRALDDVERFLRTAVSELSTLASKLDREALSRATRLILDAEVGGGRVHVSGIGKPEHVAHYAASLLSSTGTPATFLHGTEATHGSVGQLREGDVLIAISNSGETRELLDTVGGARRMGAEVIAVTAARESSLGGAADAVIEARVGAEGGPLDLAPRASVLAQVLALAALSVSLQSARGLTRKEYARRHPAGALGRKASA